MQIHRVTSVQNQLLQATSVRLDEEAQIASMDAEAMALEITRLKMRAEIHEMLLLQMRIFVPHTIKQSEFHERQQGAVSVLEGIASSLERDLMASSRYARLSDSERALYADELREIVEHMKTYISSLGDTPDG